MLPRDLAKKLGRLNMDVKPSLDEAAAGEYDYMTATLSLSYQSIKSFTPEKLRALIWHEMAHWLYFSAYLNPNVADTNLRSWRAKIDTHWKIRIEGQPSFKHSEGWHYIRDGLIKDYAGRQYDGQEGGIEIPSVYLEQVALGPDIVARWCELFPTEKETFDIAVSIFEK